MSDSLQPHGLQRARLPCLSLSPRVCSNNVHWVSDAIQPSHPLLPSSPPAPNLSQQQGLCIRWPKYWSFSISPSNEYSGLISFRIDWFDLLAFQGTLNSLLQYHNSKAPILWCSVSFMVQLLHPYISTGKILALAKWTFVGKGGGSYHPSSTAEELRSRVI